MYNYLLDSIEIENDQVYPLGLVRVQAPNFRWG